MLAAQDGHSSCVELLLRRGANRETKSNVRQRLFNSSPFVLIYDVFFFGLQKGNTALDFARRNNHDECFRLLEGIFCPGFDDVAKAV